MNGITTLLLLAATAMTGLLAGASLDQSIKQLPARHKMGLTAFSAYAQAADLSNGIAFYAIMGIGAAALTILAAVFAFVTGVPSSTLAPLVISVILTVAHTFTTTQAAPTYFSQRKVANDEAALSKIFNRFEFWQTWRVIFQLFNFVALLITLYLYTQSR